MVFNMNVFSQLAIKQYEKVENSEYLLHEVMSIFCRYFEKFEQYRRIVHPNIRSEQIFSIIERMPYLDVERETYIVPGDYCAIIDKHFQTEYSKCDYNINHFFSGNIRLLRYYEVFL